jgi:subtilisin family serine protease
MRSKLWATASVGVVVALSVMTAAWAAPNDTYFNKQWGLVKIQAEQAWATTNGAGALVAVVDTGADLTHPDLDANLVSFSDADFVDPRGGDGAQDENGHGTHVSGIVAAETGNGIGVAGVAPGAKVLPVRVLDADGSGTTDVIAEGITYAADKGADVINLSLGITSGIDQVAKLVGALDSVYDAIDYAVSKGVVVVVAAGNDSVPLCAEPSGHPQVICVGATDSRDVRSFYSNSDPTMTKKFVVAPGGDALTCAGDIFSTYLRSQPASVCSSEPGYEAIAGTSMAAPHVSGVAALLAAKGLSASAIVDCITRTTDDIGVPGRDPIYGYGRVNAFKAVTGC